MRNFYRNLRIKNKLFIILLAETLILSLISIISLQLSFYTYDEQLYDEATEVLKMFTINVENKLKQVSKLSHNIISNKEVQDYLAIINNDLSLYNRFETGQKLNDKLLAWALSEKYIFSIKVIDTNGHEYEGGIDNYQLSSSRFEDIRKRAGAAEGRDLWFEPFDEDKTIVSARVIRAIPSLSLESLGTLMIRLNPEKLIDWFYGLPSKYDSNIMILSGNRIVFGGNDKIEIDQLSLPVGQKQGYIITKFHGNKFLIAYTVSDYTNWTYLNIIPYKSISKQTSNIRVIMMVLYFCIFIVVQYLGINFARGITRPLEGLSEEMKKVENGKFEEIQTVSTWSESKKDEVSSLEYDFTLMVEKINTLIHENYTKQIMIKESELKALHAQINPHFLYNTLDSIHWLAKLNKQFGIAMMVKSLGNLLRNSISKQNYVMTIGEEAKLLEDYIAIQKIRYEERLEFNILVDETVRDCMIAKLTLQPIVENSINYGLEQLPGVCIINVKTILHTDLIEFLIEDNGPGIEQDFLTKLKNNEIQTKGSGIGLRNIDERIKMIFGEQYGLCINSTVGKGTVVSVCLPYVRRGKHV